MKKTAVFCPIFNKENIWEDLNQNQLKFDTSGLFRPLEMILFPNKNLLTKVVNPSVSKVSSPDMENHDAFYTLNRFLVGQSVGSVHNFAQKTQDILSNLLSYLGRPYVWGGNWVIDDHEFKVYEDLFFDQSPQFIRNLKYLFSGLDCSGLLYAATSGKTPRNTSELVHFGEELKIKEKTNRQIQDMVKPLDILVWKGHVLIFLNNKELIESRHGYGVVKVDAKKRLEEIRTAREPSEIASDKTFLIRRPSFS